MEILWGGAVQGIPRHLYFPPNRQDAELNALPGERDQVEGATRAELEEIWAGKRDEIRPVVERWIRNNKALEAAPATPTFKENSAGNLTGKAASALTKGIKNAPLVGGVEKSFGRALVETGYNPGAVDDVMEALEDPAFWRVLNGEQARSVGNFAANEALGKAGVDYDGGEQDPPADSETGNDSSGAEAQLQRLPDKMANAGYATEVDNIMMDIYRLGNIEKGIRPDLLLPPRQAERQRDLPPGNEDRLQRFQAASDEEKAATKRRIVDDLEAVLARQGEVRKRLAASKARPGVMDDPKAALARIGVDNLAAFPKMIPGVAQVIGANESFYKTIGEFEVDPEDYRAVAELAVTEDFAEKWKINYDSYMLGIPAGMAKDYVKNILLGPVWSNIKGAP